MNIAVLPFGLAVSSFNALYRPDPPEALSSVGAIYSWTWEDLVQFAGTHRVESVELPAEPFINDGGALAKAKALLAASKLRCVVDMGLPQLDRMTAALSVAHTLGAPTLRVVLSHILCGERRSMEGGWKAHLERMTAILQEAAPAARELGVTIAVENHQDITSGELVKLCETVGTDVCGVCFDVVNPLAVAEDIDSFAQRIGPYIKNVHLKDYRVHHTAAGFRLQRCALGNGIVDWKHMWALLDDLAPASPRHIELGAVHNRHVRFLEESFWPDYPPRPVASLIPVLRLREQFTRPVGESWTTPHERGESQLICRQFELDEVLQSIDHLRVALALGRD